MKTRIITVPTPQPPEAPLTFPCLMEYVSQPSGVPSVLALATDDSGGVVVFSNGSAWHVGFVFPSEGPSLWSDSMGWKRVTEPTVVEFNSR